MTLLAFAERQTPRYTRYPAVSPDNDAGLPKPSAHELRKAAARRLAEAGCSPHQIQAITGHESLAEVTRYTTAADQERIAREAMKPIGED